MGDCTVTEDRGIITVTFDRQAKRNAISPGMTEALWGAVNALADRDDLRVLVITGAAQGTLAKLAVDISADIADRTVQRHVDRLGASLTLDEARKHFGPEAGK